MIAILTVYTTTVTGVCLNLDLGIFPSFRILSSFQMMRSNYIWLDVKKIHLNCWWVTVVRATVAMAFIPTATVARLLASAKEYISTHRNWTIFHISCFV